MAGLTPVLLTAELRLVLRAVEAGTRVLNARASVDPSLWYVTRALATSAYVMLTLAIQLGMLRGIARQSRERLSWIIDELHAVLSTLALVLVLGHLMSLLIDPFLPFTLSNLLVPLAEPYKPLPMRLGVLAVYCMVLLVVSSWLRRWISYRIWRGLHYLGFLMFALATVHGLLGGSDAGEPWARGVYAGAAASVVFLALLRVFGGNTTPVPTPQQH